MYVREGDAKQAVRVYDQVANQERSRRLEMQFYAARALASLGDPDAALLRFSRLIERDTAGRWRKSAELERNACRFVTKKLAAAEAGWWSLANDAGYHDERPVLLGLAGLAAHELGRTEEASRRWQSVVSESPLSLAAAFATARLREVAQRSGEPSLVAGSDVVGAASSRDAGASAPVVALPRRTKQLLAFGIDELAADSLHEEDQKNRRQRTSASVEQACRAWATVAYGEHGYIWSRSVRDTFDVREPINDATRWRWQCRFPQPYRAMVEALEQEYRLPRLLLWAVMRQESGFDPDVTSPAGAVGLLQLLPQTASRVAEEFAINDADDLTEPRTNLRLGAAYLRKLLDSFAENLVLAVAAYNAGPKAVALWLRHSGSNSVELFAARIPYAETQRYVERVLGNLVVYRTLNGFDRNLEGLSLYLPEELKDWSALY
jgi:soluble lytic murein transglycosylase